MQDSEKAIGKYKKIMPDAVKIHEPKDETHDIKPDVLSAQPRE